jgi:glucose/mannose-6-phosphate isomerase
MFKIKIREIENLIASMEIWGRRYKPESPTRANDAKIIAEKIWGRIPIFVGAEHLAGNLHALRNQINECAKQFAAYLTLPELNHYAMEGLAFPAENKDNLIFIFFESKLYSNRIKTRLQLTKKVIARNKLPVFGFIFTGADKTAQAFEFLAFGSWVSFYLGMLNGVDPVKIPWVDWFKKELK